MRIAPKGWRVATWNVEGLTDVKLVQLQTVMERRNIGVLCVQETHRRNSDYFCTEEGYLVVLSGGVGEGREWAGVGFIFAPFMRRSLIGFRQLSSRTACAKIRVQGGKIALWSVYAPHGGKPPDERQAFYTDLGVHLGQSSSHGTTLVCGDFNARPHRQNPDEQDIVGPFVFGNPSAPHVQGGNRDLLIELCVAHGMIVANTFVNAPPEQQITYYEIGSSPHEDRNYRNFAQLDFILTPRRWAGAVADVRSCMEEALATHHFLVEAVLDARVDKPARKVSQPRYDKAALQDDAVAQAFSEEFAAVVGGFGGPEFLGGTGGASAVRDARAGGGGLRLTRR